MTEPIPGQRRLTPLTPVVVTGGASGMGRATCLALAEVGRPIAVWDIDVAGGRETQKECQDQCGVPADFREVDLRDSDSIYRAASESRTVLGQIGGLVHAAGIAPPGTVDALSMDDWDATYEVHLKSVVHLARALLKSLREAGPGSAIVVVASTDAVEGFGGMAAYCAAKAGVLGLMRSLSHGFAGYGIRANAVLPGATDTPMLRRGLSQASPEVTTMLEGRIPLGRFADPSELAHPIRFLLSDEASYITGQTLIVDGGMTSSGGRPQMEL